MDAMLLMQAGVIGQLICGVLEPGMGQSGVIAMEDGVIIMNLSRRIAGLILVLILQHAMLFPDAAGKQIRIHSRIAKLIGAQTAGIT